VIDTSFHGHIDPCTAVFLWLDGLNHFGTTTEFLCLQEEYGLEQNCNATFFMKMEKFTKLELRLTISNLGVKKRYIIYTKRGKEDWIGFSDFLGCN
jgi:hypothetical protein